MAGRIKHSGVNSVYITQPAKPAVVIVRSDPSLSQDGFWQLDGPIDWSA
jgi:hypothetical protein